MQEQFKEITYGGSTFMVGNLGSIYRNGKLVQQHETFDGYYQVGTKSGSVKSHRLVAMCFVEGRTAERNEVNHKDFNRKNNRADNLEWMTHTENIQYSVKYGKPKDISGEKNPNYGNHKLSQKYADNPELSQEKQSRPGAQNGRATPVDVYQDGKFIVHCDYLGECCDYMNTHYGWNTDPEAFRCGIRRSHKYNKPYKGFDFVTSH